MLTRHRTIAVIALATAVVAMLIALWLSSPGLFNRQPGREGRDTQSDPNGEAAPTLRPGENIQAERIATIAAIGRTSSEQQSYVIMTLAEARKSAPFQILTPEYLPEGYAPQRFVGVIQGPVSMSKEDLSKPYVVRGIALEYFDADSISDPQAVGIRIEQGRHLRLHPAREFQGTMLKDIAGFPADVWEEETIQGRRLVMMVWEDPSQRIGFHIIGETTVKEALRVARSLR